ncbi:MAG: arsenosugar biosynthesis radical SAM (seleno)protein ArsS [Planctomycetota bacterium]
MSFEQKIKEIGFGLLKLDKLQTLQVNLGNRCNQSCAHCHVEAGPNGENIMTRTVMQKIIDFLHNCSVKCVDITGGCPELNPDFRFFIENVHLLAKQRMVRTNLTVFFEPGLDWVPQWYSDHNIVIIGSLPCYTEENVNGQRGDGVFEKSIAALRMLNGLGYGSDENLELDLVYNPGGEFLPVAQQQLEADYKRQLNEKHGIKFNNLFTITNAPIGRFKNYLQSNGKLESYQQLLIENFNPQAIKNIMCLNLLSIDYKGIVYNCDFNQALDLPIIDASGSVVMMDQLEKALSEGINIITDEHCFCCTAGAGSSCRGSLVK